MSETTTPRREPEEGSRSTYRIEPYGLWDGESPAHALAAMHRDAGYAGVTADESGILWPPDMDAETIEACGDVASWRVTEVTTGTCPCCGCREETAAPVLAPTLCTACR